MEKFDPIASQFNEGTYYTNMSRTPENQGATFPDYLVQGIDESKLMALTDPQHIGCGSADLRKIVETRRSVRRYDTNVKLSLEELSYLLWLTQGVKKVSENTGISLRNVPSAGSRHPFETFLGVSRVEGLEPGIYHYIAHKQALLPVKLDSEVMTKLYAATLNQNHVLTSAVTFIWVAIPYRTYWRYGTRAYRYIHLDAGHVCQNLTLAAESIDYGVCEIGAYEDEKVNELLQLDGKNQFAIYLASVGKKLST